jgi:3(or 17)beta-hydroxysteroid dehydrogenase
MVGRVHGKVALVTGGASGLGEAIARRLAEEGATVIVSDIQSDLGRALAEEIGGSFIFQDVTDEKRWETAIAQIEADHGGLHILVNNAGIEGDFDRSDPETTSLAEWRAVQGVNVEGVLLGCRASIPLMTRSGGGSIVNLSSIAGLVPAPGWIAYGASKATVRHLTRSIAVHCARNGSGIRCNSVHPGEIVTPMLLRICEQLAGQRGITREELLAEIRASIPQGEFQEPRDVANAVLFLASDEAHRVTGIQLAVDGGKTA